MTKQPEQPKTIFALGNDPKDCIKHPPALASFFEADAAMRVLMFERGMRLIRRLELDAYRGRH